MSILSFVVSSALCFAAAVNPFEQNQAKLDRAISALTHQSVDRMGSFQSSVFREKEKNPVLYQVHGDLSQMRVSAGKILFGRTINRIILSSGEAPVQIQLDQDQATQGGIRLSGIARASSVDGRIIIDLQRLHFRSGKWVPIQAVALDSQGALGLTAEVFSSKTLAVAGAMASSFVAGLAATQQSQSVNAFGFTQTQNTGRNAVLGGVAQTAADQSKRLIDEATAEKPILLLEQGSKVSILVQEEVRY